MNDNPYRSPSDVSAAVGTGGASREYLRKVAKYQRGILLCILIQLLAVGLLVVLPLSMDPQRLEQVQPLLLLLNLLSLAVGLASMVFVFLLGTTLYSTGAGVAMGLLALIPCIGLIVLLIVNGKATSTLRQNGIKVGLLGADSSQL